ncbi:DUF4238 domain-containing protein [Planococcus sp. ISL-109]|uniref:DUF4238 domain-containing protein n=1 Tax=Planococcus sp. ISL-109 TaxID=2819166 RepID=UPI001BEADEF8|nr:DUF4238 domain-containing protein [Planococcus sp. ISL-109]MBT2584252.1 DUF4238 domain-containing protein [Planococcus sp. ISL-109]
MNQLVKNQHYIPRCVLKHFSNEKKQVFEASLSAKKVYPTNYSQSMSQRYTYEHPNLEVNKIEGFFSKIEDYFGPAIHDILNKIKLFEEGKINVSELKIFVEKYIKEFLIFYYRSGALLHEFSFLLEDENEKISHLLDKILDSAYINDLGKTITQYYNFSIIKSKNQSFLLSDQYISTSSLDIKAFFGNLSNRNIGLKDVVIFIPISNKYYISYFHGNKPYYISSNKVNELFDQQVREVNKVIINNSYNKCIGTNKYDVEEGVKVFKDSSPILSTMYHQDGYKSGTTMKKENFYYSTQDDILEFFIKNQFWYNKEFRRNDPCPCGRDKKYKKCCKELNESVNRIIKETDDLRNNYSSVMVNPKATIEKGIAEFFSLRRDPRNLKGNIKEILSKNQ